MRLSSVSREDFSASIDADVSALIKQVVLFLDDTIVRKHYSTREKNSDHLYNLEGRLKSYGIKGDVDYTDVDVFKDMRRSYLEEYKDENKLRYFLFSFLDSLRLHVDWVLEQDSDIKGFTEVGREKIFKILYFLFILPFYFVQYDRNRDVDEYLDGVFYRVLRLNVVHAFNRISEYVSLLEAKYKNINAFFSKICFKKDAFLLSFYRRYLFTFLSLFLCDAFFVRNYVVFFKIDSDLMDENLLKNLGNAYIPEMFFDIKRATNFSDLVACLEKIHLLMSLSVTLSLERSEFLTLTSELREELFSNLYTSTSVEILLEESEENGIITDFYELSLEDAGAFKRYFEMWQSLLGGELSHFNKENSALNVLNEIINQIKKRHNV